MTLSPADVRDHIIQVETTPLFAKFHEYAIGTSTMIEETIRPGREQDSPRFYARNSLKIKQLAKRCGLKRQFTLRSGQVFDGSPGTLLVTQYGIFEVQSRYIKTVVIYINCRASIEISGSKHVVYISARENLTVTFKPITSISVAVYGVKYAHTPIVSSIRKLGKRLHPGMSLWYATIGARKDIPDESTCPGMPSQHIALFQCNITRRLYCSGCKRDFDEIEQWRSHFDNEFMLPGKFFKARFDGGTVIPCPGRLDLSKPKDYGIQNVIRVHGYEYKSLNDKIWGRTLTKKLYDKLTRVASAQPTRKSRYGTLFNRGHT